MEPTKLFARQIAKALAALLVPFILAGLAWLTEQTGVDVPFDPSWVETVLVSVVAAVAVWWRKNAPTVENG